MNVKKLIFLVGIIGFSSCVGYKRIDIPLSIQEKMFYEEFTKNSPYPVDSITREIEKELYRERNVGMFIYIYTSVDSLNQDTVDKQADEIASFISGLEIDKLRFQKCFICFDLNVIYNYKLDNGECVLIDKH
jgi:hypothetical protein